MKIKKEHVAIMSARIKSYIESHPDFEGLINTYERGAFPRAAEVKDLQTRFSFDLMDAAGLTTYVCKSIYTYANDNHLLTALKTITPKVSKKY